MFELVSHTQILFTEFTSRELNLLSEFSSLLMKKLLATLGPSVSTTPITTMGCRQSLLLSVVQLKGKHCRKPHCGNGVVDMFELGTIHLRCRQIYVIFDP